jgi:hypothetical protein
MTQIRPLFPAPQGPKPCPEAAPACPKRRRPDALEPEDSLPLRTISPGALVMVRQTGTVLSAVCGRTDEIRYRPRRTSRRKHVRNDCDDER